MINKIINKIQTFTDELQKLDYVVSFNNKSYFNSEYKTDKYIIKDCLSSTWLYYDYTENWIIDDPEQDKSKKLGHNYPKGTWMISTQKNNEFNYEDDIIKFHIYSNSKITDSILNIILIGIDGKTPQEIIWDDFSFIKELRLDSFFEGPKNIGINSVLEEIKKQIYLRYRKRELKLNKILGIKNY